VNVSLGHVECSVQLNGDDMDCAIQLHHFTAQDLGNISLDKFQAKYNTGIHIIHQHLLGQSPIVSHHVYL
jgi:hypothetical protein